MSTIVLTLLLAFGLVLLCFAGIGIAMLIGRRKRIGACSCSFDADAERNRSDCASCDRHAG